MIVGVYVEGCKRLVKANLKKTQLKSQKRLKHKQGINEAVLQEVQRHKSER